jgi:hypothetical protein
MIQHLRRLKYYKYLFFFSTTVQIFVIVCGIYFLFLQLSIDTNFEGEFSRLEKQQSLYNELKAKVSQSKYPDSESPKGLKEFYISLGQIENIVQQIDNPELRQAYQRFEENPRGQFELWKYEESISEKRQENLYRLFSKSQSNKNIIIAIGLLSLFFGLILPIFIIAQVSKLLRRIQKDINEKAVQISSEWIQEKNRHGDEAFKSFEFWAKIGLTSIGQSSRMTNHPMALLLGDLALQIRTELERNKGESPSGEKDADNIHSL